MMGPALSFKVNNWVMSAYSTRHCWLIGVLWRINLSIYNRGPMIVSASIFHFKAVKFHPFHQAQSPHGWAFLLGPGLTDDAPVFCVHIHIAEGWPFCLVPKAFVASKQLTDSSASTRGWFRAFDETGRYGLDIVNGYVAAKRTRCFEQW